MLWHDARWWSYGGQASFVGKRFADEANTKRMPAYLLAGVYVQRLLGPHTSATLRVDNLLDDRHAEDQLGYPVIGRSLSLRLEERY